MAETKDENLQGFLESKQEEEEVNPEEEVKGDWAPAVDLPLVDVVTGEENTDLKFKARARLYRWREDQWKERGTGDAKLLLNQASKKISFVLRQESTKKVVCNFVLEDDPLCNLDAHAGSDKAWLWMSNDFSEEDGPHQERFCIRFNQAEEAKAFKETFVASKEYNKTVRDGAPGDPPPTVEDVDTTPTAAPAKAAEGAGEEEKKE